MNSSHQSFGVGSAITPIMQMPKRRTERLNHLPKVTQAGMSWGWDLGQYKANEYQCAHSLDIIRKLS